jgi:hypothetical protein
MTDKISRISHLKEIIPPPSDDIILNAIKLINGPYIHKDLYAYLFEDKSYITQKAIPDTIDYGKYFEQYVISTRINRFAKLIKISKSSQLLSKMLISGRGELMIDAEIDISEKYNVMDKNNINTVVGITTDNFINLAKETYKDESEIIKQCILDLPRQNIFLNYVPMADIDVLTDLLKVYNRNINIEFNSKKFTTSLLALLLICQSSFFVSFVHLHNKMQKMKDNISDMKDSRHNLHVVHNNKNNINIIITHDTFLCSFDAFYKIIDTSTNETVYNVNAETLFDLDSDISLIVYKECS